MSNHSQALEAALASDSVSNAFADNVRRALVIAQHVQVTGLDRGLVTASQELTAHLAFMASDKSGDVPAGTIVNPKSLNNSPIKDEYVAQRNEDGTPVLGGNNNDEQQYDVIKVRNPKYNPNIPTHVFKSTTGLNITTEGLLEGADISIRTMLIRLRIASKLSSLMSEDIEIDDNTTLTFQQALESVVTV